MLKKFIIIFLLGFALKTPGQNLITNGSFEQITDCFYNVPCVIVKATGWYTPSDNSPDIFNSICNNGLHQPDVGWGFQHPHSGEGFAGGMWYYLNRECMTNRLTETLKPNKVYCLQFYISLGEGSYNVTAIDRVGIYFSTDSLYFPTVYTLPVTPQIETPQGVFFADTAGWTQVNLFYTAQGGEKYITLGNFYPDSLTDTMNVTPESFMSYYYIDDVSLLECDGTGINENTTPKAVTVYPNPASNSFNIQYNFTTTNAVFELYDIQGKRVDAISLQGLLGNYSYQNNNLAPGVYLYRVTSVAGVINIGKLVIIK